MHEVAYPLVNRRCKDQEPVKDIKAGLWYCKHKWQARKACVHVKVLARGKLGEMRCRGARVTTQGKVQPFQVETDGKGIMVCRT